MTVKVQGEPGTTVFTEPIHGHGCKRQLFIHRLAPRAVLHSRVYPTGSGTCGLGANLGANAYHGDVRREYYRIMTLEIGFLPVQLGSIQGHKFFDANQDGVKDASEPGLPGWIVYIDANNNGVRDVSADTDRYPLDGCDQADSGLENDPVPSDGGPIRAAFSMSKLRSTSHTVSWATSRRT